MSTQRIWGSGFFRSFCGTKSYSLHFVTVSANIGYMGIFDET